MNLERFTSKPVRQTEKPPEVESPEEVLASEEIDEVDESEDILARLDSRDKWIAIDTICYIENKKYTNLNFQVAVEFIVAGHAKWVAENPSRFAESGHQAIVDRLLKVGKERLAVENLEKFTNLDHRAIAIGVIDADKGELVAENLDKFIGVNHQAIADRLIKTEKGWSLAFNLEKFIGLNHQDIANRLIDSGVAWAVAENLDKFTDINRREIEIRLVDDKNETDSLSVPSKLNIFTELSYQEIADRMIESEKIWEFLNNIERFTGLDRMAIVNKLIDAQKGEEVLSYWDKFIDLDHMAIADRLIDTGQGRLIAIYLEKFIGLDHPSIAVRIIEAGSGAAIAENMDKFTDLDHQGIADKLMSIGKGWAIVYNLDKFTDLVDHQSLAVKLIDSGSRQAVLENITVFNFASADEAKYIFNYALESTGGELPFATLRQTEFELSEKFGTTINSDIRKTEKMFGSLATHTMYTVLKGFNQGEWSDMITTQSTDTDRGVFGKIKALWQNIFSKASTDKEVIPKILSDLGVSSAGSAGIEQLRDFVQKFKQSVTSDERYLMENIKNPLVLSMYKKYVRFKESEWGSHTDGQFAKTIKNYNPDKHQPLNPAYTPSETINIQHKEDTEPIVLMEDFKARFRVLQSAVIEANQAVKAGDKPSERKPLSLLTIKIQEKIDDLIKSNQEKLADAKAEYQNTDDEKEKNKLKFKLQNLAKKNSALENMQVRDLKNFQNNFATLSEYTELHHLLRTIMFAFSFMKNRPSNRHLLDHSWQMEKKPTKEDISASLNFISHVTNQETLAQYFSGKQQKQAKKKFNSLISTAAFEDQLNRIAKHETGSEKTTSFRFVPTRNLLTEFSGHIADACWADLDILSDNKNITSLTFVQNENTPHERLAGAALLLETETETGEKLLIIRGLNPLETTINQLYLEDFYTAITDYVKKIAEKDGRIAAIAIDDHAGGFGTNRPLLHAYLQNKKNSLRPIKLGGKAVAETEFNKYSLEGGVYAL